MADEEAIAALAAELVHEADQARSDFADQRLTLTKGSKAALQTEDVSLLREIAALVSAGLI